MGRFNDSYLKPALESLQGSAESLLEKANSTTNRANAESDALKNKSIAERAFRENLSVGYKVLLILVGIGILSLLLAWGASVIIKALKSETSAIEKLEVLEKRAIKSDQNLDNLLNSINGSQYVTFSDFESYFKEQDKVLSEIIAQTSNLSSSLDELKRELVNSQRRTETNNDDTSPNYSGYTLQKFTENLTSTRCFENGSYKTRCKDTVQFSNGWSYSGTWMNGQPEGDGTLTFPGGASIEAEWRAGVPTDVKKADKEEQKILKSITYFQNFPARKINTSFGNVVIGYNFDSGNDQTWNSAYCYLEIYRNNENVSIDLSRYDSFTGSKKDARYNNSNLIKSSEFRQAQDLCRYKRSGFN